MGGKRIRVLRLAVALVAGAAVAGCLASPDSDDGGDDAAQLLVNPDFEDGVSGWEFAGAVEIAPADELGLPSPEFGVHVAQLGGGNLQMDAMSQVLLVPDWASQLEVSGYRCFLTGEPPDMPWDHFTIAIGPAAGDGEALVQLSNVDASATDCAWTVFGVVTAAHAGEEIRLTVRADTDDAAPTSFAVDGLALTATR